MLAGYCWKYSIYTSDSNGCKHSLTLYTLRNAEVRTLPSAEVPRIGPTSRIGELSRLRHQS